MQKMSGSLSAKSERRISAIAAPLDAYIPARESFQPCHSGSPRSKRAPASTCHERRMRCVTATS